VDSRHLRRTLKGNLRSTGALPGAVATWIGDVCWDVINMHQGITWCQARSQFSNDGIVLSVVPKTPMQKGCQLPDALTMAMAIHGNATCCQLLRQVLLCSSKLCNTFSVTASEGMAESLLTHVVHQKQSKRLQWTCMPDIIMNPSTSSQHIHADLPAPLTKASLYRWKNKSRLRVRTLQHHGTACALSPDIY
jgi:hypothetical protein